MDTHSKLTRRDANSATQSAIGMSASELTIRNSTIFSKIDCEAI